MKSVVIIGAGGFGREVLEIFKDQNKISQTWNVLGFIDENKEDFDKTHELGTETARLIAGFIKYLKGTGQ